MSQITRGPGRELAVIAAAQVLALTTWFAASAAAPAIKADWHLSGAEVPLLTTGVQVGFVIGALTSAFVNLPDRYPAPRVRAPTRTPRATPRRSRNQLLASLSPTG